VFKKNISDGVGSRNGSIDAPLNPPLFWLDNIFNAVTKGKGASFISEFSVTQKERPLRRCIY
jgi:hypothetical protein